MHRSMLSKIASVTRPGQRYLRTFNHRRHPAISAVRQVHTRKRPQTLNTDPRMPDNKPRVYVYSLIVANVSFFLAWHESLRNPRLFEFMCEKCLISVESIKSHRYYTLVTSAFSHREPFHLLSNMYTLYIFSAILWQCPGLKLGHFITLTLGSAITGSAGYVLEKSIQKSHYHPASGASGMVLGIGAAASLLNPHQPLFLFGVIPMPLWIFIAVYAVFDGYYLNSKSKTAHSGHLGGLLWGSAYYFLSLYRFGGVGRLFQKGIR